MNLNRNFRQVDRLTAKTTAVELLIFFRECYPSLHNEIGVFDTAEDWYKGISVQKRRSPCGSQLSEGRASKNTGIFGWRHHRCSQHSPHQRDPSQTCCPPTPSAFSFFLEKVLTHSSVSWLRPLHF